MKHVPLHDRVTAEPIEEQRISRGGLAIPDTALNNKHVAFARVLEVGPGRVNAEGKVVPLQVKPGDVICFPRKAPALIPTWDADGNEKTVLMMREAEIVSIAVDMPVFSTLSGPDGRLLSIMPNSRAIPDSAYQSQEEMQIAVKEGWSEPDEIDPLPEMPS
jgi:chaperonin GroES